MSAAWSPDGRWMYFGARVGGSSHLWRQKFPDGPPEQITFGPTRGRRHCAGAGRPVVGDVGRQRVGARSGFTTRPASARSRRKATPWLLAFPGMARACSISLRGTGGVGSAAGCQRQPNCAPWTSFRERPTACCRACPSLITRFRATRRKWPSRRRTAVENRRSGWRPSTGAHHLARSPSRRSGVLRRSRRARLPVAGGGNELPGPDQEGRNGSRTNADHTVPGQVRRVARRRVGDRIGRTRWE